MSTRAEKYMANREKTIRLFREKEDEWLKTLQHYQNHSWKNNKTEAWQFSESVYTWIQDLEKSHKLSSNAYKLATRSLTLAKNHFERSNENDKADLIIQLSRDIYAFDPTSRYFWCMLYHIISVAFVLISWYVVLTTLELFIFEIATQDLVINGFFLCASLYNLFDFKDNYESIAHQCRLRNSIHAMNGKDLTFFTPLQHKSHWNTFKSIVSDTIHHTASDLCTSMESKYQTFAQSFSRHTPVS